MHARLARLLPWLLLACAGATELVLLDDSTHEKCARTKVLHLIRHAEGIHNSGELDAEAKALHERNATHARLQKDHGVPWVLHASASGSTYTDPRLTRKGRAQAYRLRAELLEEEAEVDAVIVSPFRRTIATALLGLPQLEAAAASFVLGENHHPDPPTAHSHEAVAPRPPPVIALEALRERIGPYESDHRLPTSELRAEYGSLSGGLAIDFSHVADDEDVLFREGLPRGREVGESGEAMLAERCRAALAWLIERPAEQRRLAVVTHSHFLARLLSLFPQLGQQRFANAERRRLVLCEREKAGGEVGADGARVVVGSDARVERMREFNAE